MFDLEILKGGLLGGMAGLLIVPFVLSFINKNKHKKNEKAVGSNLIENKLEEKTLNNSADGKIKLLDRWSIRLMCLGIALGIFATFNMGSTSIGFMIGFAIPMSITGGVIGLVIDFFKFRKSNS